MKNAAIVIVTSIMLLTIVSCEDMMGDFLEKAPGVDVTEDTIFSSRSQVEMFLASIYEYGVHSNLGLGSPDNGAPGEETAENSRNGCFCSGGIGSVGADAAAARCFG